MPKIAASAPIPASSDSVPSVRLLRAAKVAAIAVATAMVTVWVLWVSSSISEIPDDGQTVYDAVTKSNPYPIGTLNIEQANNARIAWENGTILGLVVGVGVGLLLTRPKTVTRHNLKESRNDLSQRED